MNVQKWMLAGSVVILLVAVALVAFTIFTPFALARGPMGYFAYQNGPMFDGAAGPRFGMGPGGGHGMFGWGGPQNSPIAIAAEKLGMTREELIAELQAGKTVADVAKEKDVALETIVEAIMAPRAERLAQLVTDGKLTQEQADTMLATMRANITTRLSEKWSPRGPGYSDADGDGVCDHAGQGRMSGRFGGGQMGGRWDNW
jgi:hypothetical protein